MMRFWWTESLARTLSRVVTILFAAGALWAVWLSARAQPASDTTATATNGPVAPRANALQSLGNVVPSRDFIERNRSALSFGLDQLEPLQTTLLGKPLWQYLASLLYVVLAFGVAQLIDRLIHHRLTAWTARTTNQWDDIVIRLFDGPVKVIVFVLLLHIGFQIFDWPDWLEAWISRLTLVTVFVSITYVLLKAVDALIGVAKTRLAPGGERAFNEQFVIVCGKTIKAVLVTVAGLTLFDNFGVNITALLGSLSVLGLALGLAAQDTVANLFGAVAVFVDKPFQLGDRIQVGAVDGTVEEMGLRSTQVRTADGYSVTVPNKTVGNNIVINISRRTTIKTEVLYLLALNTPAEQVRRALQLLDDAYRTHPKTDDLIVTLDRITDLGIQLKVVHWWKDTDGRANLAGLQEFHLRVKECFDAAGLKFAQKV